MTNSRLTDPEVLEWRFPVLLHEFKVRHGSGGDGAQRGGDGVVRRVEFLQAVQLSILSGHRKVPPYGMAGGAAGAVGRTTILRADGSTEQLASSDSAELQVGDQLCLETPGAGGYGESV